MHGKYWETVCGDIIKQGFSDITVFNDLDKYSLSGIWACFLPASWDTNESSV